MKSSYREIALSSGIIGFVQVFKIIFSLIQNKVLAVVVGPYGFGIWGLYNTYVEMISSFSTLGLDSSGVRQISKNSDNEVVTAKCIWLFKRVMLYVSILASIISILCSKYISQSLFGSEDFQFGVIIVSFVILLNGVWKGNIAILNGLRHIRELAISQVLGSCVGAIVAIISVLCLGIDGIPMFLVATGIAMAVVTWSYVKKLCIPSIKPSYEEARIELVHLFHIGFAFTVSNVIFTLMTYFSRVFLSKEFDMEAVGIYQASWTISNLYIGTILTAMGVDFMPRLMKVIKDKIIVNQIVSEQLELGILISGIGVLGILVFSPIILNLVYSNEFTVGTQIIRWQVLGVALRIFGFVFGYAIMAYSKSLIYILAQGVVFSLDYILLILFSKTIGFDGLGINYCISYISYLLIGFLACRKLFGFRFSRRLLIFTVIEWIHIIIIWVITWLISGAWGMIMGSCFIFTYLLWINYALNKYMHFSLVNFVRSKIKK